MPHCRCYGTEGKTGRKYQRGSDHDLIGQPRTVCAQKPDRAYAADGQQHLAHPDLISEDPVMKTKLERIPQKEPRKKGDSGYVRPQDRKISEQHEPQSKKTQVFPARPAFKSVDPSGVRAALDHILQVPGDDQYDPHADQQPECRTEDARFLKICIACYNE